MASVNLEGKYCVSEEEVGRGAWSVVRRCTPIPPYFPPNFPHDATFVVKVINKEYLTSLTKDEAKAMAEVQKEITILRHIPPHPNVVTLVEYFETSKEFMLIFEEVTGGDLCELILAGRSVSETVAKDYIYQLILAAVHVHASGVVHRDIKPENLLISKDSNDLRLTDFGLAKMAPPPQDSQLDEEALAVRCAAFPNEILRRLKCPCSGVCGTARYNAPEMFYAKISSGSYDGFLADSWSVGVVAYILLTASFPFSTGTSGNDRESYKSIMETTLAFPPKVNAVAESFVRMLLTKDPAKRVRLHEALDHPWLDSVRTAPVASQIQAARREVLSTGGTFSVRDVLALLDRVGAESELQAKAIQLLRREKLMMRLEADRRAESATQRNVAGRPGSAVSARTTAPTSARPATRSPAPPVNGSARGPSPAPQPPKRVGSSSSINSSRSKVGVSSVASGRTSPAPTSKPAVSSLSARTATGTSSTTARTATPLSRAAPNSVRQGTPVGGRVSPSPAPTSRSAVVGGPASRAGTPTLPAKPNGVVSKGAITSRTSTPVSKPLPSTLAASPQSASRGVVRGGVATALPSNAAPTGKVLKDGDQVVYKGCKGIVRFNGPTSFGPGVWVGIEMLEGSYGTNDGTSFVDKKRYFKCPPSRGLFARASQLE